jgi:hypothetical protein
MLRIGVPSGRAATSKMLMSEAESNDADKENIRSMHLLLAICEFLNSLSISNVSTPHQNICSLGRYWFSRLRAILSGL